MERRQEQIPLKDIEITDVLFGGYVKKVSEKIIPHQWKILNNQLAEAEPTYCIDNFRIAAGELTGERKGVVFQDTDLYKWLESVAYCIAGGSGQEYEKLADEVIDLIGRAQEPDGYLNTYYTVNAPEKKWTNLVEGHELYTAGHMIEAAVAYYEATGKEAFLNIARKNADLIGRIFGEKEGQKRGYPGHQEIEVALVKLYRVTGERAYLRLAEYFIRERGKEPNYLMEEIAGRGGAEFFPEFKNYAPDYSQAHMEPVKQRTAEGHAVRAMYMCAAMADLAGELSDEELLTACREIWNNTVYRRMYITGGIGSSGFQERFTTDYDLPNATNYSETCASIGLMMFGQRMAAVTGQAEYYEAVERALYNTVLAGINIAGDRYFYVNPLEVVPEFCTVHTYMDHVKPVRQKWFSVACCPPNVARTLASLGQYIYARDEDSIYIHQFISSKVRACAAGGGMEIQMDSSLLQDGRVSLWVRAEQGGRIKIRIPAYAGAWKAALDGSPKRQVENGYLLVEIPAGDHEIAMDFDIHARWMCAADAVRADAGKMALMKGPLVYCLEEADNGRLLSEVYVEEDAAITEAEPAEGLAGEIPVLTYPGIRVEHTGVPKGALYGKAGFSKRETVLRAVPYCQWNNRKPGEMLVWQKVRL